MLMKTGAIAAHGGARPGAGRRHASIRCRCSIGRSSLGLIGAIGAAMIPVAFAYGGWQTSSFVAAEMRDPRRDLSRGLVLGVIGVVVLYLSVNFVCLKVLGPAGSTAPRPRHPPSCAPPLGDRGALWIAVGIADLHAGIPQPEHSDRAARVLRHGPRRPVLRERRLALAAHRRAGGGHRAARAGGHRHRLLRQVRADSELRGVGGLHLVRAHGRGAVRRSAAATRRAARAPNLPRRPAIRTPRRCSCWPALGIVASTVGDLSRQQRHRLPDLLAGIPVYLYWSRPTGRKPTHETQTFRLHALGQDRKARPASTWPPAEWALSRCASCRSISRKLEINGDNKYGYPPLQAPSAQRTAWTRIAWWRPPAPPWRTTWRWRRCSSRATKC